MKKRLLILTRYDSLGASSRMRALLYCPALEAAGFEVSVRPLFGNQYLRKLYRDKRRSSIAVIASYFRRFLDLRHSVDFDLLWVEKELFPYLPAWFETRLLSAQTPYVVDYDDAVFHNYDMHSSTIVRKILERKFEPLLRGASVIIGRESLPRRMGYGLRGAPCGNNSDSCRSRPVPVHAST